MHYFIDCEFNEFGGELISLALVPMDARKPEFYFEFNITQPFGPWVKENVVPLLDKIALPKQVGQIAFRRYMEGEQYPSIIADHPADIMHLCQFIDMNHGDYIGPSAGWQFTVMPNLGSVKSLRPHHALYDARAIRDSFKKK